MKFGIALNNLPFNPDAKQVIYVESNFDEKVNAFIKDNYDALVAEFNIHGLDFVYLPLYFNADDIETKVRYYAPYLVSQIKEQDKLRSSFLLDFMVRPENRASVPPSLLFAPKQEQSEWVFQGLSLDDMLGGKLCVIEIAKRVSETIILSHATPGDDCLYREGEKSDDGEGIRFRKVSRGDDEREEKCRKARKTSFGSNLFSDFIKKCFGSESEVNPSVDEAENVCEEERILFSKVMDETKESFLKGEREIEEILKNIQTNVGKLRLMGVALGAIHEFIDELEPLSPLVITEDLRIFLPQYNNIEIELSAQRKALFFLFLNHPEGIVLQRLEDYHNEFVNYYKQTNNGVLTPKMEDSIKKLEEYGNNQLNVLITRIREAFCLKFDERLARNYFISGERGLLYRIPLDRDLVKWEE